MLLILRRRARRPASTAGELTTGDTNLLTWQFPYYDVINHSAPLCVWLSIVVVSFDFVAAENRRSVPLLVLGWETDSDCMSHPRFVVGFRGSRQVPSPAQVTMLPLGHVLVETLRQHSESWRQQPTSVSSITAGRARDMHWNTRKDCFKFSPSAG